MSRLCPSHGVTGTSTYTTRLGSLQESERTDLAILSPASRVAASTRVSGKQTEPQRATLEH
eukprot:6183999-Pleurochrysis_carterae.AAC.5